jgi:hypothetical protein
MPTWRQSQKASVGSANPEGHATQTITEEFATEPFVFVQNRNLSATNNGSERAHPKEHRR